MDKENKVPFYKKTWFLYTVIILVSMSVGGYLSNSSELDAKDERIQELENHNSKAKNKEAELNNQLSSQNAVIQELNNDNSSYKENIANLKDKNSKAKSEITELKNNAENNNKKIQELENQNKKKDSQISSLEAQNKQNNNNNNNIANYNNMNNQNTDGTVIRGNSRSKIYHMPGQRDYENMADSKDLVIFHSKEEAEAAGYRMAKR